MHILGVHDRGTCEFFSNLPFSPRTPGAIFFPRSMIPAHRPSSASAATGVPRPVAGVLAGLAAGAIYLLAQVSLTALARPGGAAEPLQRIAAILLGPDAAPPPAELSFTVFGMALIVHFALAMVFGKVVCTLVWQRTASVALLLGAATGVALYGLNFELIAPSAFPWFESSVRLATLADHALFGVVAAAVCLLLRRRPA